MMACNNSGKSVAHAAATARAFSASCIMHRAPSARALWVPLCTRVLVFCCMHTRRTPLRKPHSCPRSLMALIEASCAFVGSALKSWR